MFENWRERKIKKPEDYWSCIAHLSAEVMWKSEVIEEKKFKNIESDWIGFNRPLDSTEEGF